MRHHAMRTEIPHGHHSDLQDLSCYKLPKSSINALTPAKQDHKKAEGHRVLVYSPPF